ncbi:Spy/CpxP family protein refolding chaperone [Devosia epidermidihirudinis]|uniref:Spy/CpxP family protein refolding chaperone n=1 Tax=Devosia epidermidihirudinis TaxID=1293439 RepID=UPI000695BE9F|nr:Spy/CpxP family protein refolding chaperone [Devosia epidermidihirudinis]
MKTISTTAIVALMTATLGLSAIAPAFARDNAAPHGQHQTQSGKQGNFRQHDNKGPGQSGPGRAGGLGGLLDFNRGGEGIEIAIVQLSHRLTLTDAQTTLLNDYKTAALSAASTFEKAVETLRPQRPDASAAATATRPTPPTVSEQLANRIALQTAQLDALKSVQPSLTAFFDSLTDEQKTQLSPQRPERVGGQGQWGKGGPRHGGPGAAPAAGEAPAAPPAPAAAPAPATNG